MAFSRRSLDSSGAFPVRVAGQPAAYLTRQLTDFRSGACAPMPSCRRSPGRCRRTMQTAMSPPIMPVSRRRSRPWRMPISVGLVKKAQGARRDRRSGQRHSRPAVPRHGAGVVGEPPAIPYLAGQYAHYTAFQLQMCGADLRRNSPEAMALFVDKLDDQQIQALAAYYQQARSSVVTVRPKE